MVRASLLAFTTTILLLGTAMPALARAGGGVNAVGGGILATILLIIASPFVLAYLWWRNRKINKKSEAATALLSKAEQKDAAWNQEQLETLVRTRFMEIERAWCQQDMGTLKKLLHPNLLPEWTVDIQMLKDAGQQNRMEGLGIESVKIVEAKDYRDNSKDSVTYCINAHAKDYTIDRSGAIVDSNTSDRKKDANREMSMESFEEFWTFRRSGDDWLLERVDQSGDWRKSVDAPLVDEG